MNRYQKITAMEPCELAEFLVNYEDVICETCISQFCEYSTEEGDCKVHPDGACREATVKWLLAPVEEEGGCEIGDDYSSTASGPPSLAREGIDPSSAEVPPQDDNIEQVQDDTGLPDRSGTSREEILREAIKCVCTDRNEQYGEPEDNFDCIAGYWQKFLEDHCVEYGAEVCITPEDVAIMMMLFKIARYITADRPTVDTFVDIAGYAACAAEICGRKRLAGGR